jgi:hypothetical protein
MEKSTRLLALSLSAIILTSCGGGETSHDDKSLSDSTTTVVKDTTPVTVDDGTKFKFDFALANIPSPASSINELSSWGQSYDNSILNDTKNSKKYTSEFARSINLGIYNIDMCYAIVSERGEDVLKYMKTVLISSDALGLKGAVDQMIGKRAEQNLANKDSLLNILDEILIKSDSYLRTNERLYTATTVFAGSWVESLYITCKIGENTTDEAIKAKAHKHLWEQRFHLNNLITVMDDYKDKKEAVELNKEFRSIHEEINAIKKAEDIDAAKFKSISEKIFALRTTLTK